MGRCRRLQLHAASQVMDEKPFHDYLFVVFILFLLGRVAEVVKVLCFEAQDVCCYVKEVEGEVAEL